MVSILSLCFWFTSLYSSLELCSEFQIPVCNYQPVMSIWLSQRWLIPNMSKAEPLVPLSLPQKTCNISSLLHFNKWHSPIQLVKPEIWASSLIILSPLTLPYNSILLLSLIPPNYISRLPTSLHAHQHQTTIISHHFYNHSLLSPCGSKYGPRPDVYVSLGAR